MRALVVGRELLGSDPERFTFLSELAFERLKELSQLYPEFQTWYESKVIPGLLVGERSLLLRYMNQELAAVAVLKHDGREQKLCSLRTLPKFQGSGIGLRLFEDAFEILGTERPLLSVAAEQQGRFLPVFNHFGFTQEGVYRDLYRSPSIEYSYNGPLIR